MKRILLVVFFLEIGFILLIVPWSRYWDQNYFALALPQLRTIITNNFVRGAVSGLGIINVLLGMAELIALLAARHRRQSSVGSSSFGLGAHNSEP